MAKQRKTAKAKLPSYERIDRKSDPQAVYDVLDAMVKKYKPELKAEDCRIALAWKFGWKRNKDGQLVLGKCKKVSDLDKQFQGFDFIIILNKEAWVELKADQQKALMHHELCHAAVAQDQNGNTKKDARNRTCFRVKKHDIEEFGDIIAAHGCYKADLEEFVKLAMRSKKPPQMELPGAESEPPATIPMNQGGEEADAKARPVPAAARKTKEARAEAGA